MAWYYGVNDSELYGSNFSTVLADAPPPLDDTYDEDENEIVFPNEAKKLKKFNGETAASSNTKSDEKFNDKSKYDRSRPPEGQGSVEEDPDFGDFAGFADFGSAFGQENSGESLDWFSGDENSTNSPPAVKTATSSQGNDSEVVDFAAFPENGGSLNQENITNGGFEHGNSNTSNDKKNSISSQNRNNSINGSYDIDSDNDFGDFASVEKSTGGLEEVSNDSEIKTAEIQPDIKRGCVPMGRTFAESDITFDGVDVDIERKIVQCNGDTADKEVVSHYEESTVNHTSEGFSKVDNSQDNEFGTKRGTNNVENCSNAVAKDEESRSWDKSYVAVQHEENQPGDSVFTEPEREDEEIKNHVEGEVSSSNKGKESLENVVKLGSSSTFETGSEAKTLPEDNELNDDGFGEFADFTGAPMHVKQLSIDDDDKQEEEELCDKQIPHILVSPGPAGDENEDSSCIQVASVQNKGDENEFGDFDSFDNGQDQNYERTTDFIAVDSKTKCVSTQKGGSDDDDFGEFGSSNDAENTFSPEAQDSEDFGDFGTFKSETKDSQKVDDGEDDSEDFDISNSKEKSHPSEDQNAGNFGAFNSRAKGYLNKDDDGFGDFDTSSAGEKTVPREDQDDDDFGDFGTFNSRTKDSHKQDDDSFGDFGRSNFEEKSLPKGDQDNGDFGNFGAFDSSTRDSQKDSDMDNDFGDFGTFESNTKRDEDNSDDFGSFESNAKDDQSGDSNSDRFAAEFGAFDVQAKDPSDQNESDNEFGNFGSFESRVKDLPKGEQRGSNVKDFHSLELKDDGKFGDCRTSDPLQNSQKKKNLQSDEFGPLNSVSKNINNSRDSKDDYGDFSGGERKAISFATFPNSRSESSPKRGEDLKQRGTSASYFVPGNNVIIKQVGDAISPCFISEQRHISHCHCGVLSSRVQQGLESNLGLWQQLERSDKEGRILFHWTNSFSKHKKLLSLTIRPDRPPPLQGGAMLKPTVSSQFTPFGGGLPGSMLMPEPYSKLPQSPSGLGFVEPVKGSHPPAQRSTQDKMSSYQSIHPTHSEIGLPDLGFVLGNGVKPTSSKSDIKDNVSDTTSESSSLDLDFFAPSTTQPSEGKAESRGLYEEDLLGLNIFSSSSLDSQKSDSPKPQTTSDNKKVWQHGGVTIPLSSQESRAQLSAAAKSILDELEDLKFMSSSVLMFPLKV